MFREYEAGRTPNPDVLCNSEIKFDAFLGHARNLGADMVATGHYCRRDVITGADGTMTYRLLAGTDGNKDQSYFLCQLSQEQLSRAIFPIGHLTKPEVRAIAREAGLPSAEKKDSQGICFVGKVDLPVFLQQQLKAREGDAVEIFRSFYEGMQQPATLEEMALPVIYKKTDGKVVGRHIGAQFYTIGQRHGLNIGGHKEPLFVIAKDPVENIIYLGEGQSHPGLYRQALGIRTEDVHWIRPDLAMAPGEEREAMVRIRYRQPLQKATLICRPDKMYIRFDAPQRGVTAGQFAAWYTEDGELTGSGVIEK
jgi:tRNA-specific 2-thiouridylase